MTGMGGAVSIRDLARQHVLVEIGCSEKTGIVAPGRLAAQAECPWINPKTAILAISAASAVSLGSHFARCGSVRAGLPEINEIYRDEVGVGWDVGPEGAVPVAHPLADAAPAEIRAYPPPRLPARLQIVERAGMPAIFDAPMPGLIETCFNLCGGWHFLELCSERAPVAEALLDWAQDALIALYAKLLSAPSIAPALVLYSDEWGNEIAPYFSPGDFAELIWPRVKSIFAAIRGAGDASVAVQIRGAAKPFLKSLVAEGVDVVGIDCNARGMVADALRREIGRDVILHGTVDLWALGNCLATGDMRGTALLATELASAVPLIAAPATPLADDTALANAARAAAFLKALSGDDLERLARLGPVKTILEHAAAKAIAAPFFVAPATSVSTRTLTAVNDDTDSCAATPGDSTETIRPGLAMHA